MTPELETYFNNYNELFNHEGFKQLIQELSNNATQLADIQPHNTDKAPLHSTHQQADYQTLINHQDTK